MASRGAASCRRQTSKDVKHGDTSQGQDQGQGGADDDAAAGLGWRWTPEALQGRGPGSAGRLSATALDRLPALSYFLWFFRMGELYLIILRNVTKTFNVHVHTATLAPGSRKLWRPWEGPQIEDATRSKEMQV